MTGTFNRFGTPACVVLSLLAGAAAAQTPVLLEDLNMAGNFNSWGVMGDTHNVAHRPMAGSKAKMTRVLLSGTLMAANTSTYGSEARIRVVAPSGAYWLLQPFPGSNSSFTTLTLTNFEVITPLSEPEGRWEFTFYESYQDSATGADAMWTGMSARVEGHAIAPDAEYLPPVKVGLSSTSELMVGGDPVWFKLNVPAPVHNAVGTWVDIDTIGSQFYSPLSSNDTTIGLFRSDGQWLVGNDDAVLSVFSALSFGQTAPVRLYSPLVTGGDGRNGPLPPGDYFLVVGAYPSLPGNTAWPFHYLPNEPGQSGTVVVNVRSNVAGPCSVADVAAIGGEPPADGLLTGDDFIAFVNAFAAGCP
jgi:hypothetical protein